MRVRRARPPAVVTRRPIPPRPASKPFRRFGDDAGGIPPPSSLAARWAAWAPRLKSVLRVVAAFMFMSAGTMKLFGFPAPMPGGPATLFSEIWFAGMLEVFGGALLLAGLFTRPVAFLLSGEMAVAYFQAHFPHGFWPVVNKGVPAVLYCFIWLYFSAAGPGPWSLDALRRRVRSEGAPIRTAAR